MSAADEPLESRAPAPASKRSWRDHNWRKLFIELVKFGTVGGLSYVIDIGLYNILMYGMFGVGPFLHGSPITSKIISAGTATIFSWVANRLWTFRTQRTDQPVRELVMFAIINLIGMGIAAGCLWFSHWVLGYRSQLADNISGNLIGTGLGTIFRYLAYRLIVFNPKLLAGRANKQDKADKETA